MRTIGAVLNSLVTMSRSPSPSTSKIAAEREPRAPQIVTLTAQTNGIGVALVLA